MDNLTYKSLNISETSFKVLDETKGIVEFIGSVFGNKDSYDERMMYGCYAKSLQERTPSILFMHNWELPVAKCLEAIELEANDARLPKEIKQLGGLYIRAQYNIDNEDGAGTQRGKDAFSDIKKGIIGEFSVGYKEIESIWNKSLNCKDVTEAYLYEVSSVVAGANPATSVISAKSISDKAKSLGKKVFERVKSEFLGENAEADMTYSAMCDLGYTMLWEVARECCYGDSMSKGDRISMMKSAMNECSALYEKVMTALLPESNSGNDGDADDYMHGLRLELDSRESLEKVLLRDGAQEVSELQALSDFVGKFSAKLSVMGELRAKDRKKEGRVFSTSNISAMDDGIKNIRSEVDKWEQLIHPPEKSAKLSLLALKNKQFKKAQ